MPEMDQKTESQEETQPFPREMAFLLGLLFIALSVLNYIGMYARFPVWERAETTGFILLCASPLFIGGGWGVWRALKARWILAGANEPGMFGKSAEIVAFGLLPFLGLLFFIPSVVFGLNGALDAEDETPTYVVQAEEVVADPGKGRKICYFSIQPPEKWPFTLNLYTPSKELFPIPCHGIVFMADQPSVAVNVWPGFLGLPWVRSYAVSLGFGRAEGPKDMMLPFLWERAGKAPLDILSVF